VITGRRSEIAAALEQEDGAALVRFVREGPGPVLRYLAGRLYSEREDEKWRAVRALGRVVGEGGLLSIERVVELVRRFFWVLNDESGAVPYGVPEAIGEILAVRPELQPTFLPLLCAHLTEEDMVQTGPIERGIIWALGRVGPPVARCSPDAVEVIRQSVGSHPDPDTRETSVGALARIYGAADPVSAERGGARPRSSLDGGGRA
jgi:hypothetical protein